MPAMKMPRPMRRFAAWAACLAVLLAALAPSISYAVATARGGVAWNEICTASKAGQVKTPYGRASSQLASPISGSHLVHCPFCLIHGGPDGLPPSAFAAPAALLSGYAAPSVAPPSSRPVSPWTLALSRAPPFYF
jgi:hypothetical protein